MSAEAPVINASLVLNLGGERQLTLLTHYARDMEQAAADRLLDNLCRAGDRQKARYDLEALEEDLAKHERTIAQFRRDVADADGAFARQKAGLEEEIKAHDRERTKAFDAGRAEHDKDPRRGDYQPKGSTAQAMRTRDMEMQRCQDAIAKAQAEHDAAHLNFAKNIRSYEEAMERIRVEIAKRQAVLAPASEG